MGRLSTRGPLVHPWHRLGTPDCAESLTSQRCARTRRHSSMSPCPSIAICNSCNFPGPQMPVLPQEAVECKATTTPTTPPHDSVDAPVGTSDRAHSEGEGTRLQRPGLAPTPSAPQRPSHRAAGPSGPTSFSKLSCDGRPRDATRYPSIPNDIDPHESCPDPKPHELCPYGQSSCG